MYSQQQAGFVCLEVHLVVLILSVLLKINPRMLVSVQIANITFQHKLIFKDKKIIFTFQEVVHQHSQQYN